MSMRAHYSRGFIRAVDVMPEDVIIVKGADDQPTWRKVLDVWVDQGALIKNFGPNSDIAIKVVTSGVLPTKAYTVIRYLIEEESTPGNVADGFITRRNIELIEIQTQD